MKKAISGIFIVILSAVLALGGAAAGIRSSAVRLEPGSEEQVTGGVVLESWQWPQKDRLLLAFSREGVDEPQRIIAQLNLEDGAAGALYGAAKTGENGFTSRLYDERVEFLLGQRQFSMGLPEGEVLREERAEYYGDYLPDFEDEYFYRGVQFCSSEEYYFCERMARGLGMKGEAVCDRILIYSNRGDNQGEEIARIGFPFQVKGNEKNLRWMRGSDRILVQAKVFLPQEYGAYETQYYVYNAPSGTLISKFTLKENDLIVQDTYKSKLLLLGDGKEPTLYLYDYREKKLRELDSFTRPVQARFSPDGKRAAVIREKRSFVPTLYELES